jgi:predicted restriction endonuclease
MLKGEKTKPVAFRDPFQIGHPEGFEVGSLWKSRRDLSENGIHAGLSKGISGREAEGAFSVVLSGGYQDDQDNGETILYTGEGGQERGVVGQVKNQVWKKGNRAMQISFLNRKPVRVIRGSGANSPYAPLKGYRYDGLYSVQSAETVRGKHGFLVCQFKLVRRPNQPPLPAPRPSPQPQEFSPPVQGEGSSQTITVDSDESDHIDFSDLEPF